MTTLWNAKHYVGRGGGYICLTPSIDCTYFGYFLSLPIIVAMPEHSILLIITDFVSDAAQLIAMCILHKTRHLLPQTLTRIVFTMRYFNHKQRFWRYLAFAWNPGIPTRYFTHWYDCLSYLPFAWCPVFSKYLIHSDHFLSYLTSAWITDQWHFLSYPSFA